MKTIKVKGNRVELFDSISELTAERDHAINKLITMQMGIGDGMDSVAKHLSQLFTYVQQDKKEETLQEIKNLHNNYYMMIEGISPKSLCFAVFVNSINRKTRYSVKTEHAQETIDELYKMGITSEQVKPQVDALKKKLMTNFVSSFLIDLTMEKTPI